MISAAESRLALSPVIMAAQGVVSGLAGWSLLRVCEFFNLDGPHLLDTIPGAVFGLIVGARLRRSLRLSSVRYFGYVIASAGAYYCAVLVAIRTFYASDTSGGWVLAEAGILGGLTGSLLLGIATAPLLRLRLSAALMRPVVVGSVAGVLLVLMNYEPRGQALWWLLVLLVVWQAAYAATLAGAIQPKRS